MDSTTRRRKARQTDLGTVPAPYETLAQVAQRWSAELAAKDAGIVTFMPVVTLTYDDESVLLLIEESK